MDIFLVVLLVILNGIFAMNEMSLVSAKKVRLQQMADKGNEGLDDVEETLNLEKLSTSGSVYTIAGFILEKAECIPSAGFKFKMNHGNFEIEIEVADMDGNTIDKVILTRNEIVNVEPQVVN